MFIKFIKLDNFVRLTCILYVDPKTFLKLKILIMMMGRPPFSWSGTDLSSLGVVSWPSPPAPAPVPAPVAAPAAHSSYVLTGRRRPECQDLKFSGPMSLACLTQGWRGSWREGRTWRTSGEYKGISEEKPLSFIQFFS